jgi:hypothetical protein
MKRAIYILAVSTLLYMTVTAQDIPLTTRGTVELSGNLSFSSYRAPATDKSYSVLNIAPQVSYFLTDNISVGLATGVGIFPGLSVVSPDGGGSTTTFQIFASPAYHFQTGSNEVIPFVEGQVGYALTSDEAVSSKGLSYGGRTGIKYVPVDHLVLTFAGQFLSIRLKRDGDDRRLGWDYWTIGIGVGAYL